jgi:sugar phosphate isomerase/epimerase
VIDVALSTGCFTGHESELARSRLDAVELASHDAGELDRITALLLEHGTAVRGVHSPCPSRGFVPDLAATGERAAQTMGAIRESVDLAAGIGAEYVVVHAFYCHDGDLPANDVDRARALRSLPQRASIGEFVESGPYAAARERARRNLEGVLDRLPADRPEIVLENLNPRIGYGGILLDDVVEVATGLDGVGICLDVGHLVLAAAALGDDLEGQLDRARDLIRVVHVHQNFGGRYFVDRWWTESRPRPGLQEVDAHLPLLTGYERDENARETLATADNRAFEGLAMRPAVYADRPDAELIGGAVTQRLLSLVDSSVPRVLELDSRYAPLAEILAEYEAARAGNHPLLSP